ncbi:MAG: class I SAM-dependent methyltransferase [Thermoleophilaceae bacterium]
MSGLAAAFYDAWYAPAERAGLAELRERQLAPARGRVLEIGAGTGLNVPHLPASGIEELILTDPDESMLTRARRRLGRAGRDARVTRAPAEQLPFEDDSFDSVVTTFTLCTVTDLDASLAELRRVLKPGGELLFLEHVRSDDERSARWQDRLERPWKVVAAGCHPNRRTLEHIRSAGFEVGELHEGALPLAAPLWRPYVSGVAAAR